MNGEVNKFHAELAKQIARFVFKKELDTMPLIKAAQDGLSNIRDISRELNCANQDLDTFKIENESLKLELSEIRKKYTARGHMLDNEKLKCSSYKSIIRDIINDK